MNNIAKMPAVKRKKQLVMPIQAAREATGRREFFFYRDLGLNEATEGRIGARTMTIRAAMSEPTGWHYHTCEAQITLCLKGWADVVFEDGTEIRIKSGDFGYIPGGLLHNEVATSDDLEAIEINIPAKMGTVTVAPPTWWVERQKQRADKID